MLNVKNKAVANWYLLLSLIGQAASATSLNSNYGAGGITLTGTSASVITVGGTALPNEMVFMAGTDTTTATTAVLGTLVTPTSQGSVTTNVQYPTQSVTAATIQWSGIWAAQAFAASGTTILGEFGIGYGSSAHPAAFALMRRVCVADGNFSVLTVDNTLPLTISLLVANQ